MEDVAKELKADLIGKHQAEKTNLTNEYERMISELSQRNEEMRTDMQSKISVLQLQLDEEMIKVGSMDASKAYQPDTSRLR